MAIGRRKNAKQPPNERFNGTFISQINYKPQQFTLHLAGQTGDNFALMSTHVHLCIVNR